MDDKKQECGKQRKCRRHNNFKDKNKKGQKQSSITFRNNCFLKFAVGDYMVFAVTKTRTRQFTLYADSIRFKRVYRRLFAIIRWAFKGALH